MKRTITTVAALAGALAAPAAAGAHVTATPSTAPAEGYAAFTLRVGHGCEGSPTTRVTVRMPDQVLAATPEAVPGWEVRTREGELPQPFDAHGETITEGVREITWHGNRLDPHQYTEFGISVRLAGEPGEEVAFPTIQRCVEGEHAWIQIPQEGEAEPDEPAPIVTLTAAEDGHGQAAAAEHEATADTGAPVAAAAADDAPSTGLVIAALAVGALGLLTGLAALASARRRTS